LKANLATAHAKILCDYGKRMVVFGLKSRAGGRRNIAPALHDQYQATDCVIECVVRWLSYTMPNRRTVQAEYAALSHPAQLDLPQLDPRRPAGPRRA